jgi:hypothetical protein
MSKRRSNGRTGEQSAISLWLKGLRGCRRGGAAGVVTKSRHATYGSQFSISARRPQALATEWDAERRCHRAQLEPELPVRRNGGADAVRQLEEKKGEVVMNVANIALVVPEGFAAVVFLITGARPRLRLDRSG